MMGWYDMGLSGWGWVAMGLLWLALILLVVVAVARLLPVAPQHPEETERESVLDVLDRRLAEGEIDVTTYHQARDAIAQPERPR